MKKILTLCAAMALAIGCGEKKEEKKEDGFEMSRTKQEAPAEKAASDGVPVDLSNKGVGPVDSIDLPDEIDSELAAAGETKFNTICIACHQVEKRMIGPAMAGVMERRSPEWVMNMMLNPDGMLKEDPIAKALLKEYNNMIMTNQNLSQEDARALLEYLRTL
ncbi:cytochrome c family protein [Robiginitalea sp. SC105]|uniref:c-type cytochrome n=1 Tax=Robiginitalea sp. SC105 TaxID=2762332 RepID=UPI00163A776A|nr:cytochrome c [Robiginitalea sp. SC105]MBC2838026.1 cytochrome c [Robiginitalea sp. SC105]